VLWCAALHGGDLFVLRYCKSLTSFLIILTVLFIFAQFYLFIAHYRVSDLIDTLVGSSIILQMLHPAIILPIAGFLLLQVLAYALLIFWVGWMTRSLAAWLKLPKWMTIIIGFIFYSAACITILELNRYYFPDSLFSNIMVRIALFQQFGRVILYTCLCLLLILTVFSFIYSFVFKQYRKTSGILLLSLSAIFSASFYNSFSVPHFSKHAEPNIIIIGLDSLRPDFTGFYGNQAVRTPNMNHFLEESVSFSSAYTPLARTFPAWVTILTGKYPLHHDARNNLVDPAAIVTHDTLAKHLQQAGYQTIYATDEKRFSNITKGYGFDHILGPHMGVNDFLLGGLSDFPLSNLIVNLPFGRFLFPYNYANRAATITYQPASFLQLIKSDLARLPDKPLFLSVHFCLSHWPHKWADKNHPESSYISSQYQRSVDAVDKQLGTLLSMLKKSGLLENAWVIILSDHGTSLGLRGDRIISEANYRGDKQKMKMVPPLKLSPLPHQNNKLIYSVNTAYGQGTNVLSLTQHHVLLAFKRYGAILENHQAHELASLLDIAPTLLDILGLAPMSAADGISLRGYFSQPRRCEERFLRRSNPEFRESRMDCFVAKSAPRNDEPASSPRPFFIETGDSFSEIETDHIYLEKVLKHEIGIYGINPRTGLLAMNPFATQSIIKNKQLAVMQGDWILARYPVSKRNKKIVPPYFVLANIKSGEWTVGLETDFAKNAPVQALMERLRGFYGQEL
jgi:arylsulfatase A-like enzyme